MQFFLIVFCNIIVLNYVRSIGPCNENIEVTIEQGPLVGRTAKDYLNDTYYIFEAVPYAKPPVGSLRFKAPEPPEPWTGVYDATKSRKACPLVRTIGVSTVEYDEDCLFVNVHTKMKTDLKPVMVYIYGGSFEAGSINLTGRGSQYLMTEDIVLVDIQYRLNIFGFLRIDDTKFDIRGNAGFKDQVMALKWVQKNIKQFGGDPKQVTIFGESAGGASVHLLYVSPLAKGLFHRAIAQSGSGANTWVDSVNKYPQLAKVLNCTSSNLDEIVNCINGTSTEGLVDAGMILKTNPDCNDKGCIAMSALTIESENSKDPFMTHPVEENIKNGNFNKVPLIIGICANESAFFYDDRLIRGPNFTESDYEKLIPKDINVEKGSEKAFNIGKQIKEFYYGKQTASYDLRDSSIKCFSDVWFNQKIYHISKVQVASSPDIPVYFYMFDYRTSLNYHADNYAYHGDDLYYLFNIGENQQEVKQLNPKSNEYIGMRRMVKLWTTFAKSKNGNPNPINDPLFKNVTWKPLDPNHFYYLHIHPNLELQTNVYEDRMSFWDNLYQKYNI